MILCSCVIDSVFVPVETEGKERSREGMRRGERSHASMAGKGQGDIMLWFESGQTITKATRNARNKVRLRSRVVCKERVYDQYSPPPLQFFE